MSCRFLKCRDINDNGDCGVNWIIVVLWVMFLYCSVIHHMSLVLFIFLYYILLFVHLKVFYLLMWKNSKKSRKRYACYVCLSVYLCVSRACVIDSFQ